MDYIRDVDSIRPAGAAHARYTSADFLPLTDHVVTGYRRTQELHIILDKVSRSSAL